jgi:tRNA/rRNA methyltransferase/tRNA (cytidine32/uridine32-2'-O)-methyltransferase
MLLEDVIIVLARPSEPGNAGAVCRAMKNMGLGRLRIVSPEPGIPARNAAVYGEIPINSRNEALEPSLEKLLARAVHAADIWNRAEYFASLNEALADCTISVGTSRRRGRHRKSNTLTPRELAAFLKPKNGKAAIVFGNERTGLNREELELCGMASHIPVYPEFPSINLSHAVQIYAYELYQALVDTGINKKAERGYTGVPPVLGQWVPMTAAEIGVLAKKITGSLASIGFYKHPGREEQERFLRDLISRAGLSVSEGTYLHNIIAKAWRLGERE